MVYAYSHNSTSVSFIWKDYLIVNRPEIRTRISVYGYVLYYCGPPIACKSKAGKSVALLSTEAEYYATSEIAKEVVFAKNLIEEVGFQLQFPITIECDNMGAIYLAISHCNSQRTKHIDTQRHFLQEWVKDDILKIILPPTLKTTADIFTKI
jgi:hypothetical protein